ncbi:M48 family metallopeptidase [Pseudomonas tolaasii]|uniref:M48 family metallopeptidase n=1 Tax=Pseudomonas tolaasii TaxID=29442 RepID=UPI00211B3112|nr:M48 family metallopeptidase [Pseudomonas tolaasii]
MSLLRRLSWGLAMLLLPLVLMGWSSIQSWRADSTLEEAQVMRQWLASPSEELRLKLPQQWRTTPVISDDSLREYLQRDVARADADQGSLHMRQVLAFLGYWLAVAAVMAGAAAWVKLRLDAWRALRSRDFLYDRLVLSWRALGQWLVVYTGLIVGALAIALLYEVSWGWSNRQNSGMVILLVVVPLLVMLYLGVLLIGRLRRQWQDMEAPQSGFLGRSISRASAPALWAWIEKLAAITRAPVPDHVVIGVDQSFFVTSVQVALQPSGQLLTGRTMYLPLTFLSTLSQEEAASIIGHELGHFSSQDTERGSEAGARFSLMYMHFLNISAVDDMPLWIERPAIWMTWRFLHHFQIAVHHWSRAQELLADKAGAQIAGERLFCQALLRVIALDAEVNKLLSQRTHTNLIQALAEHLRQVPVTLNEAVMNHAIAHPFDTHPPTALRLQQLGVILDDPLMAQATRAPTAHDRLWFSQLTNDPQSALDATKNGVPV